MEHSVVSPLCDITPGKYDKYREDTITTACSLELDLKELDSHFGEFLCDKISGVCQTHLLTNETQQVTFILGLSTDLDANDDVPQSLKHINMFEECSVGTRKFHSTLDVLAHVSQRISAEDAVDLPLNNSIYDLRKRVDVNFFANGQLITRFFGKYWIILAALGVYIDNFLILMRSIVDRFNWMPAKSGNNGVNGIKYCFKLADEGNLAQALKYAYKLLHNNDSSHSDEAVKKKTDENKENITEYKVENNIKLIELLQNHCTVIPPKHTFAALKTTFEFVGNLSKQCKIVDPKNIEVENLLGCLNCQAGNFFRSIFHFIRALSLNPYDVNTLTNLVMLYNKFGLQTEMWSALSLLNTIAQGDDIDPLIVIRVERVTAVILSKSLGRNGAKFAKKMTNDCLKKAEKLDDYPKELYTRMLCNFIEIHIRLAEYKEGIKFANEMTDKYPNCAPLWFICAKIKFYNRDFEGALGDILQSIKLDPYSSATYLYACKILTKLNYLPAAWFSFKNCVYSDPNALEFHSQCGEIVTSFGLEKYLIKIYSNLAWIYPDSKIAHMFLTTFQTLNVTTDKRHVALLKLYAKRALLTIIIMMFVENIYHMFQ